jgi:hypothetical protein
MPGQQQKPSTAQSMLGGMGDIAGLIGTLTGNDVSGVMSGFGGAGKEVAGGGNPFGFAGGVSNLMSILSADEGMSNTFGGMGSAFGVVTGGMDMMDSSKSTADRVVGGMDAGSNALALGAQMGGTGSIFAAGSGVAGASTLASSGAGAALTAGGAASAAAGGAVLGAGVAGYKAGQAIVGLANSERAHWLEDEHGNAETLTNRWQDDVFEEYGDSVGGIALGTAAGMAGTFVDAGAAAGSWIASGVSGAFSGW